ncbi:MAG: DUF1203 domain-containing protein [Candidatus Eremiobacteraeota bacterium]|nr:DUF1203 domain-containing protein [Candidatus Eremiobacteraeota bacterium]
MLDTTATLTIRALPGDVAATLRRTLKDDYGNALHPQDGEGSAPCRSCLRCSDPGEEVILFSYRPFAAPALYQEVGPVFIHARQCATYPSDAGFPAAFRTRPLILRPYDVHDAICGSQVLSAPGEAEDQLEHMLADANVAYVHARSATRGCYLFRVERAPD